MSKFSKGWVKGLALFVACVNLCLIGSDAAAQASKQRQAFCNQQTLQGLVNERLQLSAVDYLDYRSAWPEDLTPLGTGTDTLIEGFCRIQAVASSGPDSEIHFELWLPAKGDWNGKLVSTGNGGYNPALSYNDMMFALRRGYATVGGDTGHQSRNGGDISWGKGHPEKIKDWGVRSVHEITVAAKAMIVALMQQQPTRSFYYGCSTGGHQGLVEAQRYPEDFDGIIAGDPANNWIRWSASSLWMYKANHTPVDNKLIVTREQQPLIRDQVMQQCDALDGHKDEVIDDPRQCNWQRMNFASLQCKSSDSPAQCLSSAQIDALRKMYQGLQHPVTGKQEYPGLQPGTEEAWNVLGTAPPRGDLWRQWVYDQEKFDIWSFDFADGLQQADEKLGAMVDATATDLTSFRNKGGKLMMYHGWADPSVNPLDSIKYYEKVRASMGSQAVMDEFFQLYLVAGMGHCGGGRGATVFGNASLQAPKPVADNDLLMALDRWVETGKAPQHLHSVEIRDDKVISTRLLCPWPRKGGIEAASCKSE